MATDPYHHPPPNGGAGRKRKRVILFNGWLRAVDYPYLWMRHLSRYLQERYGDDLEVIGNQIVVKTGDIPFYISYLAQLVGTPDKDTYFIGQSVGCQVILRYLAQLPPDKRVGGFLATGCWLTVDYKTKATRSPGIEALLQKDKELLDPWLDYSDIDFKNARRVCPKLVAVMGDNDPFRGLDDRGEGNRRDWEEVVGAHVVMRPGKGHYSMLQLDEEDLAFVESFLELDSSTARLPPSSDTHSGPSGLIPLDHPPRSRL